MLWEQEAAGSNPAAPTSRLKPLSRAGPTTIKVWQKVSNFKVEHNYGEDIATWLKLNRWAYLENEYMSAFSLLVN